MPVQLPASGRAGPIVVLLSFSLSLLPSVLPAPLTQYHTCDLRITRLGNNFVRKCVTSRMNRPEVQTDFCVGFPGLLNQLTTNREADPAGLYSRKHVGVRNLELEGWQRLVPQNTRESPSLFLANFWWLPGSQCFPQLWTHRLVSVSVFVGHCPLCVASLCADFPAVTALVLELVASLILRPSHEVRRVRGGQKSNQSIAS